MERKEFNIAVLWSHAIYEYEIKQENMGEN
jgi:hypothetical protein